MKTPAKAPIDLQEGEELKITLDRAKASLITVWAWEVLAIVASVALLIGSFFLPGESDAGLNFLRVFMVLIIPGAILFGVVQTKINFANKMFITDRRVIYHKKPNLLAKAVKVLDLKEIETVSFRKEGILPNFLGYGTLKLATKSDETTYVFPFCDAPSSEIAKITELKEARRKAEAPQMASHVVQPNPEPQPTPVQSENQPQPEVVAQSVSNADCDHCKAKATE